MNGLYKCEQLVFLKKKKIQKSRYKICRAPYMV